MTSAVHNEFLALDFQALHSLFTEENEKYIQAMAAHGSPEELEALHTRISKLHEAIRLKRIEERRSRYMGYIFAVAETANA